MSAQKYIELCSSDKLSSRLYIQKQNRQFCDIDLILCDVHFPVHSCVVVSSSCYVEKELSFRENKVKAPRVLVNFSAEERQLFCRECAEKVVDFMYCCRIQVDPSHMPHIYDISKKLEIPELITLSNSSLSSVSIQRGNEASPDAVFRDTNLKATTNGQDIGKSCLEQGWTPEDSPNVTCPKCKESFSNAIMLQQHCNTHLGKFYTCYVCSYSTLKVPNLLEHLKDANHIESVCSLCLYEADTNNELQEHIKEHEHAQPFFCRTCYNRFQTRTALNSHIVKHSTETPFLCTVCGRGFKWKQGLQSHMVIHTSTKNHLCDQCGYSTAHLKSFQDHKRIHSGKKFKCPISACQFSSARKEGVKQHLSTHSKEKSYQCEVCGRAFSQAKNLRRHAAIHDPGAELAQCLFCPFKTMRSDKFKNHIRICYKKQNADSLLKKRRVKDKAVVKNKNEGGRSKKIENDRKGVDLENIKILEIDGDQTVYFASNSSTGITTTDMLFDINQMMITTSDGQVLSLDQDPVNFVVCNSGGSLPIDLKTVSCESVDVANVDSHYSQSVVFQQCDNPILLQVEDAVGSEVEIIGGSTETTSNALSHDSYVDLNHLICKTMSDQNFVPSSPTASSYQPRVRLPLNALLASQQITLPSTTGDT